MMRCGGSAVVAALLIGAPCAARGEIIARFDFDDQKNPVKNTGITPDGVLLQGAQVIDGRLHVTGQGVPRPGGLPDAGMDIMLGEVSPLGGDQSWRLSLDFMTQDDEGPLFSADGSLPAFGLDCGGCPGDQAGGLNVFLRNGQLNVDFWYLGVVQAGQQLNDGQVHKIDLLYTSGLGTLEVFIDAGNLTGTPDNGDTFTLDGSGLFPFWRDASQDITRLGDETTADEPFAFDISDDGFDGSLDNLVIERLDYSSWTADDGAWSNKGNWDTLSVPDFKFDGRALVANGGTATIARPVPDVRSLLIANDSRVKLVDDGWIHVAGNSDVFSDGELLVQDEGTAFSTKNLDIQGTFVGVSSFTDVENIVDIRNDGVLKLAAGAELSTTWMRVDATLDIGGDATAFANSVIQNGGVTRLNEGTLDVGFFNLEGGRLEGTGTIHGEVVSHALVRPGFSPGIIVIEGDYTQENDATLEIEIGGPEPGTEHDQLVVSGFADLAGRLDVPIIEQFVPDVGSEFVIVTADEEINGTFSVITSPNLGFIDPELAMEVNVENNDDLPDVVLLRFVPVSAGNEFQGASSDSNWADMDIWSAGAPNSTNLLDLTNQTNEDQRIAVAFDPELPNSGSASVHALRIGGDAETLTIDVGNGASLAATVDVTVGSSGILALTDGTVISPLTAIESGGEIRGNGTILGDVVVGSSGNGDVAVMSPGFSVGQITIEGDYLQTDDGTLVIEVESGSAFDTVTVTGEAQLGGTLDVVVDGEDVVQRGTFLEVLTAGSLGDDRFDAVNTVGADQIYFAPIYADAFGSGDGLAAGASLFIGLFDKGDMNQDGIIDESDIDEFSLGLTDPEGFFTNFFVEADIAGDVDFDGDQDFDDIDEFAELIESMSFAQVLNAIQGGQVPEPSTGCAALAAWLALLSYRRRGARPLTELD